MDILTKLQEIDPAVVEIMDGLPDPVLYIVRRSHLPCPIALQKRLLDAARNINPKVTFKVTTVEIW